MAKEYPLLDVDLRSQNIKPTRDVIASISRRSSKLSLVVAEDYIDLGALLKRQEYLRMGQSPNLQRLLPKNEAKSS